MNLVFGDKKKERFIFSKEVLSDVSVKELLLPIMNIMRVNYIISVTNKNAHIVIQLFYGILNILELLESSS